jgi:hypothetical protein
MRGKHVNGRRKTKMNRKNSLKKNWAGVDTLARF